MTRSRIEIIRDWDSLFSDWKPNLGLMTKVSAIA